MTNVSDKFPLPIAVWICIVFILANMGIAKTGEIDPRICLMWQVPMDVSELEMDRMKWAGVTVVHHFNIARWNDAEIGDYLEKMRLCGLRVVIYVGELLAHEDNEWRISKRGRDFIEKWKNEPALYAWHTFDEPIAAGRQALWHQQERVYRQLKSLDGLTPVMVSLNLTTRYHWENFFSEEAFDILDLHAYVNKGVGERQEKLISSFEDRRTGEYPVVVTLRAFNGWSGRDDLSKSGLREQYNFFFMDRKTTRNVGFYGWRLGLYSGISQSGNLLFQFLDVAHFHSMTPDDGPE